MCPKDGCFDFAAIVHIGTCRVCSCLGDIIVLSSLQKELRFAWVVIHGFMVENVV